MVSWRASCAQQASDSEEESSYSENKENLVLPEKQGETRQDSGKTVTGQNEPNQQQKLNY